MKTIAIFDLDGTIDKADTFAPFLAGMLLLSPRRWWRLPILVWAFVMHYGLSWLDNVWLKTTFLTHIIGKRNIASIEIYARAFPLERCKTSLNNRVIQEIGRLRQNVDHLMIATASPNMYVQLIAEQLGFSEIICTCVCKNDKRQWTGALVDGNCHGERKRELIE